MLFSRKSLSAVCFVAASVALGQSASAVLTNQFVPVGVIDTATSSAQDAFGVAYDSANDLIWASSVGTIHAFTPFKNLSIGLLPIDGLTGLPVLAASVGTTPNPIGGIFQALGFDAAGGQIVRHDPGAQDVKGFDPFTAASFGTFFSDPVIGAIGTSFFDGLDVEGSDVFWSPELSGTGRDSYKNGTKFLDDTSAAQTDISSVSSIGSTITRWAGIEAVTALGTVYTVAEVDLGAGRTVATYDLTGSLIAVDPDGSPFATRLEDLAFDGRYLYGGSIGDARIFVFEIVGPGGTRAIPEPVTAGLSLLSLAGVAAAATRRRA